MKRTIVGLRKDLQMSRDEFAKAIGIKKNTLIRYEQFRSLPNIDIAMKIMRLAKIESAEEIKWS